MNSSRSASYSCTALMGTNKTGQITPDADGYYTVVLGALDFFNSAGSFYPLKGAQELFKESSSLIRRARNGALRGEYGHPRPDGMTKTQFMARIMDIHEDKVCCHISDVWLDSGSVKDENGKGVVAIMGKVKPAGPFGPALEASLKNPKENVCFSIRSITNDQVINGVNNKFIRQICTWDYVNEPGIRVATKWHNPTLESFVLEQITPAVAQRVARHQRRAGLGIENENSLSMARIYPSLFGEELKDLPASASW